MQINNASGTVPITTVSNGQSRWWNIHMFASLSLGSTASTVTLQVNGNDPPTQRSDDLYIALNSGSYPSRENSCTLLLDDGDVVTAVVSGDDVDLTVQANVHPDEL